MKIFIIMLLFSSCSSLEKWVKETFEPKSRMDEVHEYHRPLVEQRLIPRPKYEGKLTNRICVKWYGSDCEQESIKEYSLLDKNMRYKLIELNFACHIAGKRYRVCPDREGFCRVEKHKECKKWGKKLFTRKKVCRKWGDKIINKFKPISNYQYLLDAKTECKVGL